MLFAPPTERRAVLDLTVAFTIGILLLALSLVVNFPDAVGRYFGVRTALPIVSVVVNSLVLWLAVLLAIAFGRWRTASRNRTQLESVLSSISPDALVVINPQRVIKLCNRSVTRLFGYAPGEAIGHKTDLLYADRRSSPAKVHEIHDALEEAGFHVGTAEGRRKDGSTFPLEIITGELEHNQGAVLLLRDIQERVRAQEMRRAMESRIMQKEKLESLGVLASGVAHDFNNLLAGILGNADLALRDLPPASPVRDCVDGILKAARHAADLCSQMLTYSGRGRFTLEPTDLNRLITGTSHILAMTVAPNVKLSYHLDPRLPPAEADPAQIRQIVVNLVQNASEAMTAGGGEISIATGVRECDRDEMASMAFDEIGKPGRYAFFSVKDTGHGMDEHTRRKIFEPFFTTKFAGRGIGLACVPGILTAHRGAVKVESSPGQGATFTVLLPPSERTIAQRIPPETPPEWPAGGTALVVDDSPTVLELADRMLRRMGFRVVKASSAREGLEAYRRAPDNIRFVLLDVTMPGMDGRQTLQEIRLLRPDAKVLLSSGYAEEEAVRGLVQPRSTGFLQKPYELRELADAIRALLAPS